MPTGKKIKEIRKKKKKKSAPKPAPKPKKSTHPEDIKENQIKDYIDNKPPGGYSKENTKDPGPGIGRDGKKRTATLKQDRRRNRRRRIPRIPSVNYEALQALGDYGKDISDKASSGGGAGGNVGGQDSPETIRRAKSGASFGAKYIGAFDEEDTEKAAAR